MSKTIADAEEATQEIFLEIWRQARRFDAVGGVEQEFIVKIIRRRLMQRWCAAASPTAVTRTVAFA